MNRFLADPTPAPATPCAGRTREPVRILDPVVSVSVIVTTFERPEALRRVLEALARQADRDFETLVADDGSGPATEAVIRAAAGSLPGGVVHVRQPDRGFRAAAARNRAAWASRGELLVFLDGDSIPRPGFVGAHRVAARPGWAVRGRRTLLSSGLTAETLAGRVRPEVAGPARWIAWRLRGDLSRLRPLLSFDWPIGDWAIGPSRTPAPGSTGDACTP